MAHLFIIAGHGAGDCGAVGNGYQEAERVRTLAGRIKALGGEDVTIADTSRNWYEDGGINTLDIPKDWQILELHMDSGAATARGAHVIIKAGYNPDIYDNALASFLCGILPGRANAIVGRSDIANPNRAASRGFSYRLAEFGFISSSEDVNVFNNRMDDIAKGVLQSFNFSVTELDAEKPKIINATIQNNTGDDCMRLILEEVEDSTYIIKDKANGFYMTASSAKANANVDFRAFDCGEYQKWKIVKKQYKAADYVMFESIAAPGLFLSVEKNGIGSNNLKIYTDLHNQKQKFFIREESDNTMIVMHAYTMKAISAKD